MNLSEIKCRGKIKSNTTTWVIGAYYLHEKVTLCPIGVTEQELIDNELHLIIFGGFSDWNLPARLQCHEVIPETVGRYIGRKDRHNNEIFEGDIIRFAESSKGEMCWIGSVHYDNCLFCVRGGKNKECETGFELQLSRIPSERIEVIGNTIDTPEILKG